MDEHAELRVAPPVEAVLRGRGLVGPIWLLGVGPDWFKESSAMLSRR